MKLMLGIDTGGTYTDAVVVEETTTRVVATAKAPTTHGDLATGIGGALMAVLSNPGIEPGDIGLVCLSTTLATNALVEGHGDPACLVAIGFGPGELDRIGSKVLVTVSGGHDALGQELGPIDFETLERLLGEVDPEVSAYAVAGQFSVRNPAHELAARDLIAARTAKPVTCSHELSARLDGPRRAMTALLNARLIGMIGRLQRAVQGSLAAAGVEAPLMVVRGDGSLASAAFAAERPIETVLSGPAASVIGACHLAALDEGLVVDIGGTTTDIAALSAGRPAIVADGAVVAGYRTMVEAVDLVTTGLGGDSEVRVELGPARGSAGPEPAAHLVMGPARAVPLCRLAEEHPEVVALLARQVAEARPQPGHGRLLVSIDGENVAAVEAGGLDRREGAVLEALAGGPVAELDAAPTSLMRRAVDRLRGRGLVRVATITPTDAALLLGRLTIGNHEAAGLGADLLARQRSGGGPPVARSGHELAVMVEQLLITRSTDAVLGAALRSDGLAADDGSEAQGTGAGVVCSPLVRAALAGHRGMAALSVSLTLPITAVGAPAHVYYPGVAAALGTEVVVPRHGEVANAVGAVVGRIRIRRQLTVSRPRAGQYRLHVDDQPGFASVEAARAHGEKLLARDVRQLALEAGATGPEVSFHWAARTAVVGGKEMLVEGTLSATATGRPRLG